MPVQSRLDSHRCDAAKATALLQKARKEARKSRNYQSAPTRAKIRTDFRERNKGMDAHKWQVDFGKALHLGLDCTMIAGTGMGKTMPFVMPLFVELDKMIIIISPLNALEVDQALRFQKMGLSAVTVNGDTYSIDIHKEIQEFKHRIIITSLDMCLKHDKFRQLLSTPAFAKWIAAFVIDEAHCISQWGDDFRPEYAELGTLYVFVPLKVPFLIASATLPPGYTSYTVDLGTDCPNIAWLVQHMNGAKTDIEALEFLISPHESEEDDVELIQSMVFFDNISLCMDALKHLRERLPQKARGQIAIYHSRRSKRSKHIIMAKFRSGEIKILLTMEAAGMGCDISHIEQVVEFLVPSSLSIWMQRAGRAGHNFLIAARAVLLVQPSMFQKVNPKKGEPPLKEGDPAIFKKAIVEGLRAWIETKECWREVADEYFDNGTVRKPPTSICCDNCLRKTSPRHLLLLTHGRDRPVERPMSPSSDTEDSPSQTPDDNGKRLMRQASQAPNRREGHLNQARQLLTRWRNDTCATLYQRASPGAPTPSFQVESHPCRAACR
ncbi:P-loop containing nucleoside triphosphate hydrolase protein [Mycena maculata]|uniref:DNA 3'-5' helicase n=1 Tax=Mycena maculata TaxID=230809 RepID=A0AAD7HWB2_9AGAR|nr:P-loop containing nucleoside triphosphate hydrolase protein [Mycena maculata]